MDIRSQIGRRMYFAIGGLLLVVVVLAVALYAYSRTNVPSADHGQARIANFANPLNHQMQVKTFASLNKAFTGTVVAVDPNTHTFTALTKIFDISNASATITPATLPVKKTTYTVSVATSTLFTGGGFTTLKVGDVVTVVLGGQANIYQSTDVTPSKIIIGAPKAGGISNMLGDVHLLSGTVKKVIHKGPDEIVTLVADVVDVAKLKTMDTSGSFTTPYVSKTYQVDIPKSLQEQSLAVGDNVTARVSEDIYDVTTVRATSLTVTK